MLIDQHGATLPEPGDQRPADADGSAPALDAPQGDWILPAANWIEHADSLRQRIDSGQLRVALELEGADAAVLDELAADLSRIHRIDVRFPGFADGRGYSLGVMLRTRHQYRGGLRAIGVEADNLASLQQCGYDSFELVSELDQGLIREILNNAGSPHALALAADSRRST